MSTPKPTLKDIVYGFFELSWVYRYDILRNFEFLTKDELAGTHTKIIGKVIDYCKATNSLDALWEAIVNREPRLQKRLEEVSSIAEEKPELKAAKAIEKQNESIYKEQLNYDVIIASMLSPQTKGLYTKENYVTGISPIWPHYLDQNRLYDLIVEFRNGTKVRMNLSIVEDQKE